MRVLYLVPDLFDAPGGIARHGRLVLKALSECPQVDCINVLSLMDHPRTELDERYATNGRVTYRGFGGNRLQFSVSALAGMSSGKSDLLISGHVNLAPLLVPKLAFGRRRRSLKTITFVHGTDAWGPLAWYRRRSLAASDLVLAVSDFTARRAIKAHRLQSFRVRTLHNCLDPVLQESMLQADAPGDSNWPESNAFLTVARMLASEHGKGHATILRALPSVLREVPDAEYVVVGEGDFRHGLERLAADLGVLPHVHFLGRVDDANLAAAYRHCKAFVMPSRTEGFGLVFLEAMAHDLPIVAGNTDASPEVIGDAGILVDPDDVQQVGAAITRLLQDSELRMSLARKARFRLETCFSFELFRSQLIRYMSDLFGYDKAVDVQWAS